MKNLRKQLELISSTLFILSDQIEQASNNPELHTLIKPIKKSAKITVPYHRSNGSNPELYELVYTTVQKSHKGATNRYIRSKTDFNMRQVGNALYKLKNLTE